MSRESLSERMKNARRAHRHWAAHTAANNNNNSQRSTPTPSEKSDISSTTEESSTRKSINNNSNNNSNTNNNNNNINTTPISTTVKQDFTSEGRSVNNKYDKLQRWKYNNNNNNNQTTSSNTYNSTSSIRRQLNSTTSPNPLRWKNLHAALEEKKSDETPMTRPVFNKLSISKSEDFTSSKKLSISKSEDLSSSTKKSHGSNNGNTNNWIQKSHSGNIGENVVVSSPILSNNSKNDDEYYSNESVEQQQQQQQSRWKTLQQNSNIEIVNIEQDDSNASIEDNTNKSVGNNSIKNRWNPSRSRGKVMNESSPKNLTVNSPSTTTESKEEETTTTSFIVDEVETPRSSVADRWNQRIQNHSSSNKSEITNHNYNNNDSINYIPSPKQIEVDKVGEEEDGSNDHNDDPQKSEPSNESSHHRNIQSPPLPNHVETIRENAKHRWSSSNKMKRVKNRSSQQQTSPPPPSIAKVIQEVTTTPVQEKVMTTTKLEEEPEDFKPSTIKDRWNQRIQARAASPQVSTPMTRVQTTLEEPSLTITSTLSSSSDFSSHYEDMASWKSKKLAPSKADKTWIKKVPDGKNESQVMVEHKELETVTESPVKTIETPSSNLNSNNEQQTRESPEEEGTNNYTLPTENKKVDVKNIVNRQKNNIDEKNRESKVVSPYRGASPATYRSAERRGPFPRTTAQVKKPSPLVSQVVTKTAEKKIPLSIDNDDESSPEKDLAEQSGIGEKRGWVSPRRARLKNMGKLQDDPGDNEETGSSNIETPVKVSVRDMKAKLWGASEKLIVPQKRTPNRYEYKKTPTKQDNLNESNVSSVNDSRISVEQSPKRNTTPHSEIVSPPRIKKPIPSVKSPNGYNNNNKKTVDQDVSKESSMIESNNTIREFPTVDAYATKDVKAVKNVENVALDNELQVNTTSPEQQDKEQIKTVNKSDTIIGLPSKTPTNTPSSPPTSRIIGRGRPDVSTPNALSPPGRASHTFRPIDHDLASALRKRSDLIEKHEAISTPPSKVKTSTTDAVLEKKNSDQESTSQTEIEADISQTNTSSEEPELEQANSAENIQACIKNASSNNIPRQHELSRANNSILHKATKQNQRTFRSNIGNVLEASIEKNPSWLKKRTDDSGSVKRVISSSGSREKVISPLPPRPDSFVNEDDSSSIPSMKMHFRSPSVGDFQVNPGQTSPPNVEIPSDEDTAARVESGSFSPFTLSTSPPLPRSVKSTGNHSESNAVNEPNEDALSIEHEGTQQVSDTISPSDELSRTKSKESSSSKVSQKNLHNRSSPKGALKVKTFQSEDRPNSSSQSQFTEESTTNRSQKFSGMTSFPNSGSPSSIHQLAKDSIHAVDFHQAMQSVPKTSLSADESMISTKAEDQSFHDSVPPEFEKSGSGNDDSNLDKSTNSEIDNLVFGNPGSFGSAGDGETSLAPSVAERARALESWKGGLGVQKPEVDKQEIYRREISKPEVDKQEIYSREITKNISPIRHEKSDSEDAGMWPKLKKKGIALEDWHRTRSFESGSQTLDFSSDAWPQVDLESLNDERDWSRQETEQHISESDFASQELQSTSMTRPLQKPKSDTDGSRRKDWRKSVNSQNSWQSNSISSKSKTSKLKPNKPIKAKQNRKAQQSENDVGFFPVGNFPILSKVAAENAFDPFKDGFGTGEADFTETTEPTDETGFFAMSSDPFFSDRDPFPTKEEQSIQFAPQFTSPKLQEEFLGVDSSMHSSQERKSKYPDDMSNLAPPSGSGSLEQVDIWSSERTIQSYDADTSNIHETAAEI